jgi:hypothetical protein
MADRGYKGQGDLQPGRRCIPSAIRRFEQHHTARCAKKSLRRGGVGGHPDPNLRKVPVRLQMLWDDLTGIRTEALARLGLEFRRLSSGVSIVAV